MIMKNPVDETISPALRRPKLPKPLPAGSLERLADRGEYAGFGLTGCDFTAQTAGEVYFEQVQLRRVIFAPTNADAIACLRQELSEGDYVLVKGSRGMQMEEIVEALRVK